MSHPELNPGIVRWTLRLENAMSLDRRVQALELSITSVFSSGRRFRLLRDEWLGHAVHPLITDVALGTWTSTPLAPSSPPRARSQYSGVLAADGGSRVMHLPVHTHIRREDALRGANR